MIFTYFLNRLRTLQIDITINFSSQIHFCALLLQCGLTLFQNHDLEILEKQKTFKTCFDIFIFIFVNTR